MNRLPARTALWLAAALSLAAQTESGEKPAAVQVDVNSASKAELAQLPGVGERRAEQILRMRERNGPFRCVEELQALPRLTDKQFERLRPLVQALIDGRPGRCPTNIRNRKPARPRGRIR